jgi:DNA-binding transcriptional regulator YhcF (GntR family)
VDGGASFTTFYGIVNGVFYRVATDYDFPYHVCGPQQDSGTACVASRSDFGEIRPNDWYPAGGFENGFLIADPADKRYMFTQGWYHVLRRFDRTTGQVVVLYQPTATDRFGGAPPLAFSPQNPRTLYMAAQHVLVSTDEGDEVDRGQGSLEQPARVPVLRHGPPLHDTHHRSYEKGRRWPAKRGHERRCQINANTVARVYAALERAGVIETRRGVGSFIAATPAQAHPPRDHDRRLRAFVTRILADADAAGLTLDDLIAALRAHRQGAWTWSSLFSPVDRNKPPTVFRASTS